MIDGYDKKDLVKHLALYSSEVNDWQKNYNHTKPEHNSSPHRTRTRNKKHIWSIHSNAIVVFFDPEVHRAWHMLILSPIRYRYFSPNIRTN